MIKKFLKRENGTKVAVWLDTDEGMIEFAGSNNRQYVAKDRHDYRYTHGGELYKKACELYWKLSREDAK